MGSFGGARKAIAGARRRLRRRRTFTAPPAHSARSSLSPNAPAGRSRGGGRRTMACHTSRTDRRRRALVDLRRADAEGRLGIARDLEARCELDARTTLQHAGHPMSPQTSDVGGSFRDLGVPSWARRPTAGLLHARSTDDRPAPGDTARPRRPTHLKCPSRGWPPTRRDAGPGNPSRSGHRHLARLLAALAPLSTTVSRVDGARRDVRAYSPAE